MSSIKFKGGMEVQYVDKQRGIAVVIDGSDLKSKYYYNINVKITKI